MNHGVMAFTKCITAQGFVVNLAVGSLNLNLVQGSSSFYIRQQQDSELTASQSTRAWQVLGPYLMHMKEPVVQTKHESHLVTDFDNLLLCTLGESTCDFCYSRKEHHSNHKQLFDLHGQTQIGNHVIGSYCLQQQLLSRDQCVCPPPSHQRSACVVQ